MSSPVPYRDGDRSVSPVRPSSPRRELSPSHRSPPRKSSPRDTRARSRSPSFRPSSPRKNPHRLFIGNIPKGADAPDRRDMEELFEKYGALVSVAVKEGYAFVEFENEEDMNKARDGEDGSTFRRFKIRVEASHATKGGERERRQPGSGECFNCHGNGHWARECPNPRSERSGGDRGGYRRDSYGGGRGGGGGYRDRRDDRGRDDDRRGGYRDYRRDDRDGRDDRGGRDGGRRDYGGSSYRGDSGPSRRGRDDRGGAGPYASGSPRRGGASPRRANSPI